ncbi:hypothetical protein [Leadbetterella byssophila]|uniref:hypothetical protein n=1 Tax=Leadbetterella byssophila TaxID=316068 RepID=UPI0039A03B7B
MSLPTVMIFLSIVLRDKTNQHQPGAILIPVTLFNLRGETWIHMIFGGLVAVILLCMVIPGIGLKVKTKIV